MWLEHTTFWSGVRRSAIELQSHTVMQSSILTIYNSYVRWLQEIVAYSLLLALKMLNKKHLGGKNCEANQKQQ